MSNEANQEIFAVTRDARVSPQKARQVVSQIQGLSVDVARAKLSAVPRKSAGVILKTLNSAVANAQHNNEAEVEKLFVQKAVVGQARLMKRFIPKARGSAGAIRRRSCHIKIVLSS